MPGWKDNSTRKHRKVKPATHKPKGTKRDKHLPIDIDDIHNVNQIDYDLLSAKVEKKLDSYYKRPCIKKAIVEIMKELERLGD